MDYTENIERQMEQKTKYFVTKVVKVIFFIILGLGIALLVGYIVMRLWNWLMPELFGLQEIGYWQAVGLLILAKIFLVLVVATALAVAQNPKKPIRQKNMAQ
ncbi:hypothetical protein [Maribacter halichondriae]|uniref:hypothetical protein n=1 Tax=Maribacter halichondriae TaxID=2980554 RepID=UPI0023596C05|nr:hypothetical protein [Maribacter sp. Hal144]